MSIEIANESGIGVDEAALAGLARHVLDGMGVHPLAELSVLLVDEPAMTELHLRWMGEPGPTDVLSFPMDEIRPPQPGGTHADHGAPEPSEIPGLLGDVVICPQVARGQAKRAGHSVEAEISLLCAHGILHLLGFDHAEPDEKAAMFALQDKLLGSWQPDRAPLPVPTEGDGGAAGRGVADGGTAAGGGAAGGAAAGGAAAGGGAAGGAAAGGGADPGPEGPG